MKKILRVLSLAVAPLMVVCAFLTGCKNCNGKRVDVSNGEIMRDVDVEPDATAVYEQYSKQAYNDYKQVALKHTVNGDLDVDNEEVINAARNAAAKLYAYACYNERALDKYTFFSDKESKTDLGSFAGAANTRIQEYYLRVNESEETCGYRYHYTIKKVISSSGTLKNLGLDKNFESARIRFTDQTNLLYRFEGDNIRFSGNTVDTLNNCELLTCDWKTGEDWGRADVEMVKGDYIEPENIRADIEEHAGEDNATIRGNINILADDVVKHALIMEDESGGLLIVMTVDTEVANRDEASLKMLRKANDSSDCKWTDQDGDPGLSIVFSLWGNGLFHMYVISEYWSGTKMTFKGVADSLTYVHYSYSDRDCDMTANLEMLERAKEIKG